MSLHIIIDGYNLIRRSLDLSLSEQQDLQAGRKALIDLLAKYRQTRHHRITVVFDGGKAPDYLVRKDFMQGISVLFSRNGETADTEIKRMAAQERQKALVISSDREIVDYASGCGAATMDSRAFADKIALLADARRQNPDFEEPERLGRPTVGTRKRGPSRRLSKAQRRNRRKIRKL